MEPTAQPEVVLYRDDILWVLLEGEKNPIAPSYPLRDQEVPVSRVQIFKKIAELTPFSSLDQKVFEGLFSHADGWQQARVAFLDKFQEAPLESNLDPEKIRELEEDKKETGKRQDTWKKVANLGNEPTEITKMAADNVVKEELNHPAEEFPATAGPIKETRNVVAQSINEKPQVTPASQSKFVPSSDKGTTWLSSITSYLRDPSKFITLFKSNREKATVSTSQGFFADRNKEAAQKLRENAAQAGDLAIQAVAGSNWRTNVKIFFSNPFKAIGGFFKSNRDKTSVVAQGTKKVASEMGKKSWGMMLKKGAIALLAKLGIGAATGGVGAVALAVVDVAKKILNSEKLKNLASKLMIAASVGIYFLWTNLTGLIMGSAGAFLAAPFGVGAIATGFGAGFALGMGLQNIAASLLGGTSTVVAPTIAPTAAVSTISIGGFTIPAGLSSAVTSFGTMLSGSGISTIALFGVGGGIGALLLSVTITLAAVLQQPEQQTKTVGQTTNAIFTLQKEAVPAEFPVFDGNEITVTYKLIIKAGEQPVKILAITDNLTRSNSTSWSKNLPVNNSDQINAGETKEIIYTTPIFGNEFLDCYLKNGAEVKVKDITTNQEDTLTASMRVRLGSPIVDTNQPFGYPATGYLTAIDQTTRTGGTHWSYFYYPGIKAYGGLDIAKAGGNVPVYATMRGQIKKAEFIRNSDPNKDVGGVVYLENGPYIVEYKHLDESVNNLTVGQWVERGDLLGQTFSGELGAISGPHVHYQILYNRGNLDFNKPTNWGNCLDGNILFSQPFFDQLVEPGPFVCQ